MSSVRTALICACALVANAAAFPALVLPVKSDNKGSQMVKETGEAIVIRRVPHAYFYPFSLWPLPKYNVKDSDAVHEAFSYKDYKLQYRNEERG